MKTLQLFSDKFAISLSMLCTVHCLVLPLMVTLLPGLSTLNLTDERFHVWMLMAVLPTSIYALTMGCQQHQRYHVLVPGVVGLVLLVSGLFVGPYWGELAEKGFTVLGAVCLASGHLWNYQLCTAHASECACPCAES